MSELDRAGRPSQAQSSCSLEARGCLLVGVSFGTEHVRVTEAGVHDRTVHAVLSAHRINDHKNGHPMCRIHAPVGHAEATSSTPVLHPATGRRQGACQSTPMENGKVRYVTT